MDVNSYGGAGVHGGLIEGATALGGAAVGGGLTSSVFLTKENMHLYNHGGQMEMDSMGGGMMTGQDQHFSRYRDGVLEGIALTDEFLEEYYSSVSTWMYYL